MITQINLQMLIKSLTHWRPSRIWMTTMLRNLSVGLTQGSGWEATKMYTKVQSWWSRREDILREWRGTLPRNNLGRLRVNPAYLHYRSLNQKIFKQALMREVYQPDHSCILSKSLWSLIPQQWVHFWHMCINLINMPCRLGRSRSCSDTQCHSRRRNQSFNQW